MYVYNLIAGAVVASPPVVQFFIAGAAVCVTALIVKKIVDLAIPIFKDLLNKTGVKAIFDKHVFHVCPHCQSYHRLLHPEYITVKP